MLIISSAQLNTTVKLTKTDEKTIRSILASCKMQIDPIVVTLNIHCRYLPDKLHNCDVMIREDVCQHDSFGGFNQV